jgi:hypothetical protein
MMLETVTAAVATAVPEPLMRHETPAAAVPRRPEKATAAAE